MIDAGISGEGSISPQPFSRVELGSSGGANRPSTTPLQEQWPTMIHPYEVIL